MAKAKQRTTVCTDVRECADEVFKQISTPGYGIDGLRYPEPLRKQARALLVHEGRIRYCFAKGHHVPYDAPRIGRSEYTPPFEPVEARRRRSFGKGT